MTKRILALTIMLVLAFAVLTSCGGSSLVGRWEAVSISWNEDGHTETDYFPPGEVFMDFFDDGTGVLTMGTVRERFTWSTSGNRLTTIDQDGVSETGDFNISGSTFTYTFVEDWGTEVMTFRRVNN